MSTDTTFRKTPLAVAMGAIIAGTSPGVLAQDADGFEEITVTATRRATSIQDVPYNISAISGEDLEKALITDQADLMRAVPGVAVVDRGYRNSGVINGIMIRGVNVDSVMKTLAARGLVVEEGEDVSLTEDGEAFVSGLGIDLPALTSLRRPLCKSCLDWSIRRTHLAGALGTALLDRFYDLGWARRVEGTRIVSFTGDGERRFLEMFPAA